MEGKEYVMADGDVVEFRFKTQNQSKPPPSHPPRPARHRPRPRPRRRPGEGNRRGGDAFGGGRDGRGTGL